MDVAFYRIKPAAGININEVVAYLEAQKPLLVTAGLTDGFVLVSISETATKKLHVPSEIGIVDARASSASLGR